MQLWDRVEVEEIKGLGIEVWDGHRQIGRIYGLSVWTFFTSRRVVVLVQSFETRLTGQ